jgi:hypothetical protein
MDDQRARPTRVAVEALLVVVLAAGAVVALIEVMRLGHSWLDLVALVALLAAAGRIAMLDGWRERERGGPFPPSRALRDRKHSER